MLGAGYLTACPAEPALPSAAAPAPDGPWGSAEPLQCADTHNVEELVLRQQPQGQTHRALALMAPIPWSFRLSSSFSCSRQRSFRSRGANCSELLSGPGLGRAGQHKLAENHPPASSILLHPAFVHLRNAHCAPALYPSLGWKERQMRPHLALRKPQAGTMGGGQDNGSRVPWELVPQP